MLLLSFDGDGPMVDLTLTDAVPANPPRTAARLHSIDAMRGLVIVLMALDHVRDFFHADAFVFGALDVDKTNVALYLTRWITHFCAPTFVFLAGASAFLHGRKLDDRMALSRFLFTRGLWLVVLEFTVIAAAWNFTMSDVGLQVIWALGIAMMTLAALVWLPFPAILAVGMLLVLGHNATDGIKPEMLGEWAPLWRFLHAGGGVRFTDDYGVWVVYPVLPWIGLMALGYAAGPVFRQEPETRRKLFTTLGIVLIAAFFILRGTGWYGDPRAWTEHANVLATLGDFFNVRKYPPSLLYLCITMGPVLILLPRFEQLKGKFVAVLLTFGRVPLFVYVLHLYLAHVLMFLVSVALGFPAGTAVGLMSNGKAVAALGWGFPLPVVYLVWLLVLAILYPACRWFGAVKRRRSDWWLSYL
ncbi:DUF1624 domain-containing protein [Oxalobacteraceae bacterium OM1]|nr:DUF1624 domain-containing protein [Oxalobacteraceae bacterium OM1]